MPTRAGRLRKLGLFALPLAALAAIGWLLAPELRRLTSPPPKEPEPPKLRVAGELLGAGGDPVADALDLVRRFARATIVVTLPDGKRRELSPGNLGAEIDRVRLAEVVRTALDPNHPIGREYRLRRASEPQSVVELPVPLHVSTERSVQALVAIKDDIDQAPIDAVVDLDKRELRPERVGFRLDVYGTLARLDAALRDGKREVEAAVETIAPRVASSQLGNVKFDQVLGWFETRYAPDAKHATRTYNLRQAASRLDGTVLVPGEVFDFNRTVGPRDEANGYKVAPVIAEGELVDGIGGGTCQISGTLHAAAFFAGLDIVSRTPHTRPSSYIKLGLDAAVAYPTIDFKLKNNLDEPIVIHETVKGGVVRAEILGSTRKRTVSFFRRVDEVTPFEETERETEDLPKGERALSQRGVPGFKTTVIRIVRDGAYAYRTKIKNVYPPTTQIVRVGTGAKDAEPKKLKVDRSPEYRADEYLVLTQGPDIRTPGVNEPEPAGGLVEARTPGRYGDPGWQAKLGMKVFEGVDEEPNLEDEGPAPKKAVETDPAEGKKSEDAARKGDAKKGTDDAKPGTKGGAKTRDAKKGTDAGKAAKKTKKGNEPAKPARKGKKGSKG
ncbi:MAG: VanW family protein [Deltaproteobacteria bacterium]|nr:VanW family protein [Deltaproteobacteria bacterium]